MIATTWTKLSSYYTNTKKKLKRFLTYIPKFQEYLKSFFLNWLGVIPILAILMAAVLTYSVLSPPFTSPNTVTLLLSVDLILLLCVGALITYHVIQIWNKRRQAGNRLHVRLVLVFGLIAAVPSIVMTTFAALFLYIGLESWLNERVRTAIEESSTVASAYLTEHKENIRADILAMANDLNQQIGLLLNHPQWLNQVVNTQATLRELTEAIVFDGTTKNVLARSHLTFSLLFTTIPSEYLTRARQGEVVLMLNDTNTRVRALIRLKSNRDILLSVGRFIEPHVLARIKQTQQAVQEYVDLTSQRSMIQITATLVFMLVSLLLFLAAIWTGIRFANSLAHPIRGLIAAAEHISRGDLDIRVKESKRTSEIAILSRTFNRMTQQIAYQQQQLLTVNQQLDIRRRFTETILSNVSSGVLGVDQKSTITLHNHSATQLLELPSHHTLKNQSIHTVFPQISPLILQIHHTPHKPISEQIQICTPSKQLRTFFVRMSAVSYQERNGFVVTFDDITTLLAAQRQATWSDVARRIAHEIKNPLTPILLATERLKKYHNQIHKEQDKFMTCTDIILRHVQNIQRLVNEFSAFARMPPPQPELHCLHLLCEQAVSLQIHAYPEVSFTLHLPDPDVYVSIDARLFLQALNNVLKNALDAIQEHLPLSQGEIILSVLIEQDTAIVTIEDNGPGFLSQEDCYKLIEPYITTRPQGTGLGLAIVRKIMEDHQGRIVLENRPAGGARISLILLLASSPKLDNKRQDSL